MLIEALAIGSSGFSGDDAFSLAGLESVAGAVKPDPTDAFIGNGSTNWSAPKESGNGAKAIKTSKFIHWEHKNAISMNNY